MCPIFVDKCKGDNLREKVVDFLLYRKLRFHKAKKIICPSVARCTCLEMDESKTVTLRRSRFLVQSEGFACNHAIACM